MSRAHQLLATLILALGISGGAAEAAVGAAPQYPDLKTLPPRDLRTERTDVSVEGSGVMHNVLRFSNTAWNAGQGKMVIRGDINSITNEGPAYQRIYDSTGAVVEEQQVGRYYYHAAHAHYHFENWGLYELWTRADWDRYEAGGRAEPIASDTVTSEPRSIGSKTTSCVMDEEFIRSLPGTPWPPAFPSSGCNPGGDGEMTQGLSVGWGDTYDYYRFEQWIDLDQRTLTDGDYVLRSVADPDNVMYESAGKGDASRESISDNEAITPFKIASGRIADTAPPSGTASINHVDAQTPSAKVNVDAIGRDDVSGVDSVRLSNDVVTWRTYGYGGSGSAPMTIAWDLADASYGGTSTTGSKTVYAQFRDRTGRWSATETDTIELTTGTPPPTTGSAYASRVLGDNPEGYWRLGEASGSTTAFDQRGAHPGTYRNGAAMGSPSLLAGERTNTATRYDGSDDHVEVAPSSTLSFGSSFSLEAWIKPESLPAAGDFASILTKREAYSLQFNGPRLEFTVVQAGGARRRLQAPAGAVVAGQTYHVTSTYDGSTQRLYIDGREVASAPLSGVAAVSADPLFLGSWSGTEEFFKGTIDEPAAYNTILTPSQVKSHYDLGSGASTPPPETQITKPPANGSAANDVAVEFTTSVPGATTDCQLDSGAWARCTSPKTLASLAPGAHTFRVRGVDAAGNTEPEPSSVTWTVAPRPKSTFTKVPPAQGSARGVSFEWSSTPAASSFQCRTDSTSPTAWASCTSPRSFDAGDGAHVFELRAVDDTGRAEETPSSHSFTVDTRAPDTQITSGPSSATGSDDASFDFTADESGSTFECRLDGGGWESCSSPKSYSSLSRGDHTFAVRARDSVGNQESDPATRTWKVENRATTITDGPQGLTTDRRAELEFDANYSAASFECRLDGGSWSSCSSPKTYDASEGAHEFEVRGVDDEGRRDDTPASRKWTVDTKAPQASITSRPPQRTSATQAGFAFSADESGSTLECQLDNAAWAVCASPQALSNLSLGSHTFRVRARDAAGNQQSTPTTASWTVEARPKSSFTAVPTVRSRSTRPTFAWTATPAATSFQCRVDGTSSTPWTACTSPMTITVADGARRMEVRAIDDIGRAEALPSVYSWTVDTRPPDTWMTTSPSGTITASSVSFGFASEARTTFQCKLDAGAWGGCVSPKKYSVSVGSHTFYVRAIDDVGNVDPTPATRAFQRR